jgi:hypothetical protein
LEKKDAIKFTQNQNIKTGITPYKDLKTLIKRLNMTYCKPQNETKKWKVSLLISSW